MYKIFKRPWIIVLVILALTLFFAFQIPKVELDNNNLRFVPADDEARITSASIDNTFGSSLFILVGLERKFGTIFDPVFLNRIKAYVERLEEIEITGSINSIMSTDYITGDDTSIIVTPLAGNEFGGSPEEIAELKRRLLSWELYERALFSDDFTATQILIPLTVTAENAWKPETVNSFFLIRDTAREMFGDLAEVYVTGIPMISAAINESMKTDLVFLIPLVIFVVVAIVFIPFRRINATAFSLLSVLVAVIWSIGAMPLFGIKMSILTTVLPVILIAMGSSYGLHVIIHYIEDRGLRAAAITDEEHRELVGLLLRKVTKPIFLAALTTFAGFLSLCFTKVAPIREFGFFASFGVLVSFIITVTLIPAILLIRGQKPMRELRIDGEGKPEGRTSERIAAFFCAVARHKKAVFTAAALCSLAALWGTSRIVIDNIMVEYFKKDSDIYRSDQFIREHFGGSKIVSVMLEAETTETLLHPESLGAMDRLARYLEDHVEESGKTMGFTDLVKRINQVVNAGENPGGITPGNVSSASTEFGDFGFGSFDETEIPDIQETEMDEPSFRNRAPSLNELAGLLDAAASGSKRFMDASDLVKEFKRLVNYDGAAYYEIPENPERYGKTSPEELERIVANYLVLLSGNIDAYANDPLEPTAIKTTIQLRTTGQQDTSSAVEKIRAYASEVFPSGVTVTIGGSALVENSINHLVVQSQLISIIISIAALFLIVAISYRSAAAGLICITPLCILILVNFAMMGFLGIKLNLGTAMIASVTLGVGIDYTIHFMESYKQEYRRSGGKGDYLKKAYQVSGIAIIVDALSVGVGFAVLLFSRFNMLVQFGFLVALAMITSALLGLVIIPVLLAVIKPKFIRV